MQLELAKKDVLARSEKMIKEGRLAAGATKSDREQEGMIFVGKKKNKGRKTKEVVATTDSYQEPFGLDIDIVQRFSLVNVSPPNYPNELDPKIAQLQERETELEDKGKEMLEKELIERQQQIEEATTQYNEQAAQKRKDAKAEGGRRGRPGRGGYGDRRGGGEERSGRGARGRGARGGDRGGRGGGETGMGSREDANLRTHDSNLEFEGFDDDSIYKKEPRPATSGQT